VTDVAGGQVEKAGAGGSSGRRRGALGERTIPDKWRELREAEIAGRISDSQNQMLSLGAQKMGPGKNKFRRQATA